MFYTDGDYYAVRFDGGSYYKGRGFYFSDKQITYDIKEASLFQFDWQVAKDIYFQQFMYDKDIHYYLVKVRVDASIEIIE